MAFSTNLFIFVLLLPIFARCGADSINQVCGKNFSISSSSSNPLQASINQTFAGLLANTSLYGFAASSSGAGEATVYGLTRCRGDISNEACLSCLKEAVAKIQTVCPSSAEVIIWYERCFLRYDSINFLGQPDTNYTQVWGSSRTPEDPEDFHQAVVRLMGEVKAAAAEGDGKFGRGESSLSNGDVTIYGMAQCTRDLQGSACGQCLDKMSEVMSSSCESHVGCYVFSASCWLRFEINGFLFSTAAESPLAYAPTP